MTEKKYKELIDEVSTEFDTFREQMLQKTKQEIFDEFYRIAVYNDFVDFFFNEGINLNNKGLPKKNILQDVYNEFMATSYDLTEEGKYFFMEDYINDNIKYKRFKDKELCL